MTGPRAVGGMLSAAVAAGGLGLVLLVYSGPSSRPAVSGSRPVVITMPSTSVGRYAVLEQTFHWSSSRYSDPWEQVQLTMQLSAPSGRRYQVDGFYYAPGLWEARFSPSGLGRWRWQARITDGHRTAYYKGGFRVLASRNPGYVRASPYNHFRWSFTNGSSYYPLGIGDCNVQYPGTSSPIADWGLDGGFRPPGVHTHGRQVSIDTYMRAYSRAGVNLYRWSVDNCSFPLYQTIDPSGNVYSQQGGIWGDQLVRHLRKHGFRIFMTIFNQPPFPDNPSPSEIAAIDQYVKYVVDRWGPYVDFWELMNESTVSDSWYQQVGSYLHQIDPYHHPVSTSWERPDLGVIDINSPHWYENESEFSSDLDTWQRMSSWRQAGKPVVVGEQGNSGHNWDPTSALRLRLRAWTAFFAEGTLIFFNSTFAKDNVASSIYLGPQERRYIRILQSFTGGFDPRASIASVSVSRPVAARGYALSGPHGYAAYLVAYTNHSSATRGLSVSIHPHFAGVATWIDPASGAVLARKRVRAGAQRLRVPSFTTDVAVKVS